MEWVLLSVLALLIISAATFLIYWLISELLYWWPSVLRWYFSWRLRRRGYLSYDTFRQRRMDSQDPYK